MSTKARARKGRTIDLESADARSPGWGWGSAFRRRGAERGGRASGESRWRGVASRSNGSPGWSGRGSSPPELVDEAVDRARLRSALELELPDGGRISDEVIDGLLAGARSEEEIVGPGGLLARLTKRLVERAMEVELTEHLGYEPPGGWDTRHGSTSKTLATEHGPIQIDTPRRPATAGSSRRSSESASARFEGFDDKILALYARGLSMRDIEAHLAEICGVKVGRDLIAR